MERGINDNQVSILSISTRRVRGECQYCHEPVHQRTLRASRSAGIMVTVCSGDRGTPGWRTHAGSFWFWAVLSVGTLLTGCSNGGSSSATTAQAGIYAITVTGKSFVGSRANVQSTSVSVAINQSIPGGRLLPAPDFLTSDRNSLQAGLPCEGILVPMDKRQTAPNGAT